MRDRKAIGSTVDVGSVAREKKQRLADGWVMLLTCTYSLCVGIPIVDPSTVNRT